jgi:hypothetical protein
MLLVTPDPPGSRAPTSGSGMSGRSAGMGLDEKFFVPRTPVSVIAIGETSEALLVRAILENLGAVVSLHLIGAPQDFLLVLEQGESAPAYVVICGHGDERGLIFGAYGVDIDLALLVEGSMPATSVAGRVDLPGAIVVSTACRTGSRSFADAFLSGRASAYIAPTGDPQGSDAALFVHLLFDQLLQRRKTLAQALHRLQTYDTALCAFSIFKRGKPHS